MDLGLKGKTALITGAGSQIGFGKAIALTLAGEGCDIAVNDLDLEDAQKTAADVEALGQKAIAIKADITQKAEVKEMVNKTLDNFSKIDILVNNAGAAFGGGSFLEQEEEVWDKNIALNLKGTMLCAQAVLPHMLERKYGKIINISSSGAKLVFPAISAYPLAKGAVFFFTRYLARMVVGSGIIVNSVAPGWSLTNFDKGDPEELKKNLLPGTPAGRPAEPRDIANTTAFLASDVSEYIVGQIVCVDGGATMT
jgi:NAD(P)-dependent dehydrogenase (short-subunit alcohol dehydrogenase family)